MVPDKVVEQPKFLPMTQDEMHALGWDALDVLLVSGDAYVDHPSFAMPLLGRLLLAHGFRVGLICQPRWDNPADVARLGRPRLFCGISSGALDSMVAHYTAFRKKRHDDAYTPGGKTGARPNRATIVYTGLVKRAFSGLPVVIGGIEASLRRISHYDFWTDKVRRSILLDSKAELLVYGMGERAMVEAAYRLGKDKDLTGIPGTVHADSLKNIPGDALKLPSHEEILKTPKALLEATLMLEQHVHAGDKAAVQEAGGRAVVLAPPAPGLEQDELDFLYGLPYQRCAHPSYDAPIPAEAMIQTSITSHRGCGGGCSFCSLALHQGRKITSRSRESILEEIETTAGLPSFKGAISDIGGPSADMWNAQCALADDKNFKCKRSSCMTPSICRHFMPATAAYLELLRAARDTDGVRHVRIASGLRYDLAASDPDAFACLLSEFVGGQLKVAPEHSSDSVLKLMRKPSFARFEHFLEFFGSISKQAGKEQYVVPYLLSAFPGTTDKDMKSLSDWLKSKGWSPKQVQCFIPTPGTVATAMFHCGLDPSGKKIYVARTDAERMRQHALLAGEWGRKNGTHDEKKRRGKPAQRRNKPYKGKPPRPAGQEDRKRSSKTRRHSKKK